LPGQQDPQAQLEQESSPTTPGQQGSRIQPERCGSHDLQDLLDLHDMLNEQAAQG